LQLIWQTVKKAKFRTKNFRCFFTQLLIEVNIFHMLKYVWTCSYITKNQSELFVTSTVRTVHQNSFCKWAVCFLSIKAILVPGNSRQRCITIRDMLRMSHVLSQDSTCYKILLHKTTLLLNSTFSKRYKYDMINILLFISKRYSYKTLLDIEQESIDPDKLFFLFHCVMVKMESLENNPTAFNAWTVLR
jgi:hypothetical protein